MRDENTILYPATDPDAIRSEFPTLEKITREMAIIDDHIARIKHQVEMAKARKNTGSGFADPVWFQKANHALRKYGQTRQKMQEIAADYRKQERRDRSESMNLKFIEAAKVLLSSDQIKGIWDLVHMRDSTP